MSKTLVDFWRLIWQERPQIIVMVTNLKEGSKSKCEQYGRILIKNPLPLDISLLQYWMNKFYQVSLLEVSK